MSAGPGASAVRGRTVSDLMASMGHEQIVYLNDHAAGLHAVIAIHSTALGPALGGVRFWHYPQPADAVVDALRLSAAMTYKAAVAGLHQGGGKAVVHWAEPDRPRPPELLRALGRAIDDLGGRYLAAEDVGATTADMNALARETPWVTGVDESLGGSGDPSPVTAVGVRHGMRATCAELDGEPSLRGRRVVVQGAGHVGSHLVRLLVADGADVVVSDVDPRRADALARELGVDDRRGRRRARAGVRRARAVRARRRARRRDDPAAALSRHRRRGEQPARGNALGSRDRGARHPLRARLRRERRWHHQHRRGVHRVRPRTRARRASRASRPRRRACSRSRRSSGITPLRAAERLARQRIEQEGSPRRWEPGDPAAWTAGEPLRTLRPA